MIGFEPGLSKREGGAWSGRSCRTPRMYEALRDYGDRLDTVGIFTFEVDATGTLSETGTSISSMMTYINKWPHIHWMLTVMNHGTASIFTALRNNTNGAKDKFFNRAGAHHGKIPVVCRSGH